MAQPIPAIDLGQLPMQGLHRVEQTFMMLGLGENRADHRGIVAAQTDGTDQERRSRGQERLGCSYLDTLEV
jgi:hypothetical protein